MTGNKLEKQTIETAPSSITTKTAYLGTYVYRNDTLQFLSHEEGRVRKVNGVYVYDYFVKDHLGNTRMVLTDELQQDTYPAATLEQNATTVESNYYTINPAAIAANPAGLPTYQNNNGNPPINPNPTSIPTNNSLKVYKLNGQSGDKTGLGITVKVMSGDNVMIYGKSFWHTNGSSPTNSYNLAATDLLTLLAGTSVISGANKVTSGSLTGSTSITNGVTNWLSNAPATGTAPKAYVNWILFDEQFKPVSGSSGFDAVSSTSDDLKSHGQNVSISKNGYLYVYASNESNVDVFFDNLQLIHNHGPLLEETHYYPFGLTMAGISSKALTNAPVNREKFNGGTELNNDFDINLYETNFRSYDAQIGRFHQIDPLADGYENWSPFVFGYNNPIYWNDPLGLEGNSFNDWGAVFQSIFKQIETGDLKAGHYYQASSGEIEFQGGSFSWDKKSRILSFTPNPTWLEMPEQDEDGNSTGNRGHIVVYNTIKKEIPDTYMPYQESGWDYFPVIGGGLKAYDHFKKGRWGWGMFHSIMAVGDVFAVKAAVTSLGKAAFKIAAKEGMTELQLVTKAAQKAEAAIGGSGGVAGTLKHTYAKNLLSRYQSMYGGNLSLGSNYFNGPAGRGFLDAVNHSTKTIYDFKFGNAFMSNSQFLKYSNSFPGYEIQIIKP